MAFNLIKELRKRKVEYIVAPYEADAQLAYLSITGQVDAIITEDSDLVAYGAPCMIFKMGKEGYGQEVKIENISLINKGGWNFMDFNLTMVRQMCILSGCDYLPSLPGMGLKTSYKLIKEHRDIQKVLRYLRREKGIARDDYEQKFNNADFTFLHQRVWDPVTKTITTVLPFDREYNEEEISFIGPSMDNDIAEKIAMGVIDPETLEEFDPSIPLPTFTFNPQPKKLLYSSSFVKTSTTSSSTSLNGSSNSISLTNSTTSTTITSSSSSNNNGATISYGKISQFFEKMTSSSNSITQQHQQQQQQYNSDIYDSDDEDNVYIPNYNNNNNNNTDQDEFVLESDYEDDDSFVDDEGFSPPTMGISHFSINSQQKRSSPPQQQQQSTSSKYFSNSFKQEYSTPSKSNSNFGLDDNDGESSSSFDQYKLQNNNSNNNSFSIGNRIQNNYNNNNNNNSKGKKSLVSSNERFSMNFFEKFQFTKKESFVFRNTKKSISDSSLSLSASIDGAGGGNEQFNTINEDSGSLNYSGSYNSNSYNSLSQPLSSSNINDTSKQQQQQQQKQDQQQQQQEQQQTHDKRKISSDDYSSFILKKPKYNGNLNTSSSNDDSFLGKKSHSFSSFDYADNVFDDDDFIGKPTPTKNNNNSNNNSTITSTSPIQSNLGKIQSQNGLVFTPKHNNNNQNNNNNNNNYFITPNNNNNNNNSNITMNTTPITPKHQ